MPSGWWGPARLRRSMGHGIGRVPDLGSPSPGLWAQPLSPALPSAGSACCCWCVLPRPGSCGASSTPSCGTGGSTGTSRAPSGEPPRPPGYQQGSSRGNLVCARDLGRRGGGCLGRGGRSQGPGLYPDQSCGPPSVWTPSLGLGLLGSSCSLAGTWLGVGQGEAVGGAGPDSARALWQWWGRACWVGNSGRKHVLRVASGRQPISAPALCGRLLCPHLPSALVVAAQAAGSSLPLGMTRDGTVQGGPCPFSPRPPPLGLGHCQLCTFQQPEARLHQDVF